MRSFLPSPPQLANHQPEQNFSRADTDAGSHRLSFRQHNIDNNSNMIWHTRLRAAANGLCEIIAIGLIYLVSDLLIWILSLGLAPKHVESFSSVVGMLLVFFTMLLLCLVFPSAIGFYTQHIKSKVDFINRHMGVAFAIPMVMLNAHEPLPPRTIGLVIAAYTVMSLIAWPLVFFTAKLAHCLVDGCSRYIRRLQKPRLFAAFKRNTNSCLDDRLRSLQATTSAATLAADKNTNSFDDGPQRNSRLWNWLSDSWVLLVSFFCIFAIGIPIQMALGDARIVDGSTLWFIWTSAVISQRNLKAHAKSFSPPPRHLKLMATLANPVLVTILLMTSYVRMKAFSMSTTVHHVLHELSSDVQLYRLWTLGVKQALTSATRWFGAGDAALSLLGCGIVVWGFKLHECRRQLFSTSGLVTVLVGIAAAAANVYLGTYLASIMGLGREEALAFAGRMTTLALAIPAMKNAGGNTSVTVALVITNGILGQLTYPSCLNGKEKTRVRQPSRKPSTESCNTAMESNTTASSSCAQSLAHGQMDEDQEDDANTVAAGVAIGINGGVMGVAHLYENKSRSAPYAALAMTTYGVVTVVFMAANPFRDALLSLV